MSEVDGRAAHLTHYIWWVVSSFFIRLRGTRGAISLALSVQFLAEGAVSSLQHAGCHMALKSEALHRRLHISNPPHATPSLFSVPCLLLCVIYIGMLLLGMTAGSLGALIQQDSACKVIHVCSAIDSIRGRCWQICRFTADLKSFSAGISQANSLCNDTQPACQQIYLFTGSHSCPSL